MTEARVLAYLPAGSRSVRDGLLLRQIIAIAVAGCGTAVFLGVVAATRYGVLALGAALALLFAWAAITAYVRDPVLALLGLWVLDVFNSPLSSAVGYFSTAGQLVRQGDEVLVLAFAALTIWRTLRSDAVLPPARLVIPGVGFALFGMISGIAHGVPTSINLTGALLSLKLWIMIVLTLLLPWERKDLRRVYNTLMVVGVMIALLGLGDYLSHGAISRALHTNGGGGGSYRAAAVQSIFPTPGDYSLFMSLLFALAFAHFTSKFSQSDLLLALLFAGSVVLSLRLKGFLSLTAVVGIVGVATVNSRRAAIALLVGATLVVGAYAAERSVIAKQVTTYTSSETSARSRLYATGEQIASEEFPFGLGFGRFASYVSRTHYSPAYYKYGLSRIYGLSPRYPNFIDDTSWPSIIGEAGYGGFAFYVAGMLAMIAFAVARLKGAVSGARWIPLAALCAIAVLVVDSLGDPSLFSWLATVTVAIIFAPTLILGRLGLMRESKSADDGKCSTCL